MVEDLNHGRFKKKPTPVGFSAPQLSKRDEMKEDRLLYKTVAHLCIMLYVSPFGSEGHKIFIA